MDESDSNDDETGMGISHNLQTLPSTSTTTSTLSVSRATTPVNASNATTLAAIVAPILGDEKQYLDQEEYTKLLQDGGTVCPTGTKNRCPNKTFEYNNRRYKSVWELAFKLRNKYTANKWSNLPKNATKFLRQIAT